MNDSRIYYVYAYIRLDNNTYFYIGKGKDNRCFKLSNRKPHFLNIINKTNCAVEILYENLTENEAFYYEMKTIDELVHEEGYSIEIPGYSVHNEDLHLVNQTWGGEGTSGYSIQQSEETIARRAEKNRGQKRTDEQKERIGNSIKKFIEEHPEHLERLKTQTIGRKVSDETKEKLRQSKLGTQLTEEHKQKIRDSYKVKDPEQLKQEKELRDKRTKEVLGHKVFCIELNREFPSIDSAIKILTNEYGIKCNSRSLRDFLKGRTKRKTYCFMYNNTELHWRYVEK